jgi:hypothetical protein
MTLHTCTDCGLMHDHPGDYQPPTSDAVRIAELETHRDVEVARLSARAEHEATEAAVDVAEVQAGAELATAEGQLEGTLAVIDAITPDEPAEAEPAPDPVIVDAPAPGPDAPEPPEIPHQREPAKAGLWPYA